MKVAIIVQARMTSSRYPGKVLAPLAGKPVISHVLDGLDAIGKVIVATTAQETDAPLVDYRSMDTEVYAGSEHDVLERFYEAAVFYEFGPGDLIVRITGDCPLLDKRNLKAVLSDCIEYGSAFEYYGHCNEPDGDDFEIFTYDWLDRAHKEATHPADREHVTPFIRRHANHMPYPASGYADCSYSINTIDDLKRCEWLIQECGVGASYKDYCQALRMRNAH